MNRDRLLQRFLRYVQIDTTAGPDAATYPSSAGPTGVGAAAAWRASGDGHCRRPAEPARHRDGDRSGLKRRKGDSPHLREAASGRPGKWGCPLSGPTVALCSHLDTSPETTGAGIRPQVIENYPGGDIVLPGDPSRVIRVADNPELDSLRGRTLITSDGTTLLGADDKAGVAIIMETAAWLVEHPEIPHGPLRICFTCDEEIGHGVDKLESEGDRRRGLLHARRPRQRRDRRGDVFGRPGGGDGPRREHPSVDRQGTDDQRRSCGRPISSPGCRAQNLSPETTDDREGFLHPYDIAGGVGEVKLKILLRDFDASKLAGLADRVRQSGRGDRCGSFPRRKSTWPSSGSIATWPKG